MWYLRAYQRKGGHVTRWVLVVVMLWSLPAWASGPTYTDNCTLTWNANTEADLAGYKFYTRATSGGADSLLGTVGLVTQTNCVTLGAAVGQHFISMSAYDTSGNESSKTDPLNGEFVFALTEPTFPPPTEPSGSGGGGGAGSGATIVP